MSPNAAVDIHTLIAAGRVIEAGTQLAMHGEELPPDMRQELEQERQRLWQRASELVTEAEALEQAGWTEEAWTTYHKAAKIANDLPDLQETLKRMDEAMALTKAVQHRSKRIRQNAARVAGKAQQSRRRTPLLLAAVILLGIGAGLWLVKTPPKTATPGATATDRRTGDKRDRGTAVTDRHRERAVRSPPCPAIITQPANAGQRTCTSTQTAECGNGRHHSDRARCER